MTLRRHLSTAAWSPLNLLQALFTLAWTAGCISLALVVSALGGGATALAMARRLWAPGLLAGAGARLEVEGLEHLDGLGPCLVVANHSSWIDIPALFRALPRPVAFLAKSELGRVPLLGAYIRGMGMVLVDRSRRRSATASVADAAGLLASGRTVVSFPEGTRSRDGRLGRFRSGAFGAALATGVPVVPVALVGAGAVLPPGGFRVRPGRIEVRVGAPIASTGYPPDRRAELAEAARGAIATLLSGRAVERTIDDERRER